MKRTSLLLALLLTSGCVAAESAADQQLDLALAGLPTSDRLQCELTARMAVNPEHGFLEQVGDSYYTERLCLRAMLARRNGD